MSIALRNKYLLALIIMALLTLFVLTFVMLSTVAHVDVWHSIGAAFPHS